MYVIKKSEYSSSTLNTFIKLKNGGKPIEFDFKVHIIVGLISFVQPKESNIKEILDKSVLKGFVYDTYIINDIDYVAIKTANDDLVLPSHIMLLPAICIEIINTYALNEGISLDHDFDVKFLNPKLNSIDEWVELRIKNNQQPVNIRFHYDDERELIFFKDILYSFFGPIPEKINSKKVPSNKRKYMIEIEKIYTTYNNFVKFLFFTPFITLNTEVYFPVELQERLKYDFETIMNNFSIPDTILLNGSFKM